MKNQKMTIIVVVSCCVAVFAVLLLVLFLAGVITTTAEKEDSPLTTYNLTTFEYLDSIGEFSVDDLETMDSDTGGDHTWYEWESSNGIINIKKSVSHYADIDYEIILYSYYNRETSGHASISHLDLNENAEEKLAYGEFISWCEENNLTPDEVMEALDQYSESVK